MSHNKTQTGCQDCDNCMYLEEGDSMCDVNDKIILEDWIPTDDYFWCNGKEFDPK